MTYRQPAILLIALSVMGLWAESPATAQNTAPPAPDLVLIPSGPRENPEVLAGLGVNEVSSEDALGASLAILDFGAAILAGAPQAPVGGLGGKGAAYVFQRSESRDWSLRQKLAGLDRNTLEQLGYAVAAGDGFLAVSAPGASQVFVYEAQPDGIWTLQTRLSPQIGGKLFGGSLAADGLTLAVGDTLGVYLYMKDRSAEQGWRYMKRISLKGIEGGPCRVAISGDTLLVGCQLLRSSGDQEIGGAAIYSRDKDGKDNWGRLRNLPFPLARPGSLMGTSVALDGAVAAVGSSRGGAVYIYENSAAGWELAAALTLLRQDSRGARFGASLAVRGSFLLAGAPAETVDTREAQGAAYVFERNAGGEGNWGAVARWTSSEGQARDAFGNCVAARDGVAAIGGLRKVGDEPPLIYISQLPGYGLPDMRLASSALSSLAERVKPKVEAPPTDAAESQAPAPPEAATPIQPGEGAGFKVNFSLVIQPPSEAGPDFGASVALSPEGNWLAAGEPSSDLEGQGGKVHIYQHQADAWKRLAILPPGKSVAAENARRFGGVLALGADGVLAVGGPGVAEIWVQVEPDSRKWARLEWQKDQALPPASGFGSAVAVWGNLAAIGAPQAGAGGLAKVFRVDRVTGKLEQLPGLACPANGSAPSAEFGAALSWTKAGLAVGAPNVINKGVADRGVDSRGAIYYYRMNNAGTALDLVGELRSRQRESTGTFGRQVAMAESLLAVADPGRDMLDLRRPGRVHSGQGAVLLYSRPGKTRWKESMVLTSLLGARNRGFGSRMALDPKAEILAVLAASPENTDLAAVHLFRPRESSSSTGARWVEAASFTSPTPKDAPLSGKPPIVKGGLALAPGKLAVGLQAPNGQSAGIWVLNWTPEMRNAE